MDCSINGRKKYNVYVPGLGWADIAENNGEFHKRALAKHLRAIRSHFIISQVPQIGLKAWFFVIHKEGPSLTHKSFYQDQKKLKKYRIKLFSGSWLLFYSRLCIFSEVLYFGLFDLKDYLTWNSFFHFLKWNESFHCFYGWLFFDTFMKFFVFGLRNQFVKKGFFQKLDWEAMSSCFP